MLHEKKIVSTYMYEKTDCRVATNVSGGGIEIFIPFQMPSTPHKRLLHSPLLQMSPIQSFINRPHDRRDPAPPSLPLRLFSIHF